MLIIRSLNKTFSNQNVINQLNLKVQSGEIISVVGSSGSGKTTLLRLVSGLEIPDSGQIILNNQSVNGDKTYVPPEKRDCSLVFQDYALFPNMTMRQNIYFGKNSSKNKARVEYLINITKLEKVIDKYPHECSGGEQQRVALVRSMAINPSLILMDEPLSNLDYNLKSSLGIIIRRFIKEFSTTAIIVTHDIFDAMKISDKMVVLDDGKISQKGLPNEIYNNPNSKKVALLFGETNFIPLSMFPNQKNYFIDTVSNTPLVSIRPNQFSIFDPNTDLAGKVFSGEIRSLKKIGTNTRIELKCDDLSLNISLNNSEKLEIGQTIKVKFS